MKAQISSYSYMSDASFIVKYEKTGWEILFSFDSNN